MELSEFKKGMRVRYVPSHAYRDFQHKDCQNGVVSSTNDKYVFVKHDNAMGVMVTRAMNRTHHRRQTLKI